MKTLLKILTLPIWLPFKILWFMTKLIAFVVLIAVCILVVLYFI